MVRSWRRLRWSGPTRRLSRTQECSGSSCCMVTDLFPPAIDPIWLYRPVFAARFAENSGDNLRTASVAGLDCRRDPATLPNAVLDEIARDGVIPGAATDLVVAVPC